MKKHNEVSIDIFDQKDFNKLLLEICVSILNELNAKELERILNKYGASIDKSVTL